MASGWGAIYLSTVDLSTGAGPYESYAGNPILTNKGTDEYFQTVGHADFFTDREGNWWGAALSTRSGSDFAIYPMGRETVLYPVSWPEGGWPVAEPVRGEMSGWHRPAVAPPRPDEIVVDGADVVDFGHGEKIPENWGHENTLQQMGTGGADILTGGLGRFVGTLVGAYATNNNGNGTASAYLSRWRYTPIAHEIAKGVYVPVKPVHP
ncbi:hypothetical protein V490_07202 [Pseudogymnoascus sp. VKM F-3557]|nr:hypothetical protein V490_07202 [Pseudogymnoascus sp. VKM F-3557]